MVKSTTVETPVEVLPATPPTPRAIHTASQVLEALQKRYDGPIEEVDGFSYIPWNESTDRANEIFGYLGWSSTVVECEYVECEVQVYNKQTNSYELRDFKGFKSTVRIGVQVWDEVLGMIVGTHHDGVGFGPVQGQGNKNPMDGSCKAAKSDGISTAIKHYGDAFGLFLYKKENKQGNSQGGATSGGASGSRSYSGGASGGRTLSEKQAQVLVNRLKLTQEQVSAIPYVTAKQMLDGLFGGSSPDEVMRAAGYEPVKQGANDRLPIPR